MICPTNGETSRGLICTAGKFDGVMVKNIPENKKCKDQEKQKLIAHEDIVKKEKI